MTSPKVNLETIKQLRDQTGAPIGDVRNALDQSGGDPKRALEILKQKNAANAEKRASRSTGQGRIEAYVHHDGRMGALVEIGCETDFVARTPDFVQFSKDLALHVAAMGPQYLTKEDAAKEGVTAAEIKSLVLLEQPFVKDQGTSVGELVKALIGKTGENVVIKRFAKFAVGQS